MKSLRSIITATLAICAAGLHAQAYFQQEVNYTIDVKLNDVSHELQATEKIEYINHSPDALSFIYMHLWPNAYKDNTTPLAKQLYESGETKFYYAKEKDRGYIDGLEFKVDDEPVKWELLKDSIDICKLYLNRPLQSGQKMIISTPFHVKLPAAKISRLGHLGQSYMITQWYPKPAVYDKSGWHYMPYLNQGEFYSEFGSFDVSITVPKNYVLGATGDMVNGEKEIEWLNQKVKETEAITYFEKDMSFPESETETKTLQFRQSNVHDFAWFCDKRYHVLKGEIETPHNKRKVTTWAFFTNAEAELWKKSISYINDAVYYYSLWNGDYPYNHCTAVDGTISAGTGMEYPNITVIGTSGNAYQLDIVIAHEVGHNWFYGMLGSNERDHPWLDEGINSFYEMRYSELKYPDRKFIGNGSNGKISKWFDLSRYKSRYEKYFAYVLSARTRDDQPVEAPAYEYTDQNYGAIVYAKTPLAFDYLMNYLGEKKLDELMQHYFEAWKFKHPQPEDLKKILTEDSGKDLSWFFNDLINSTTRLDYKIAFAHRNNDGSWDLGVKNNGDMKGPVFVQGIKDKKLVGELNYEGFLGKQALTFPKSDIDYFKIDFNENMPEINQKNNTIRTKGLFKRVEPLRLQFLGSFNNPAKTQLFWAPALGWNNYNKFMLGAAFYNALLPRKAFEFELMPFYSFGTKNIAGYGHLAYTLYPNSHLFHHIQVGVSTSRYAYSDTPSDLHFNKIAPELIFEFRKKRARSLFSNTLKYRFIHITKDAILYHYHVAYYDSNMVPVYALTQQPIVSKFNFHDLTYKLLKEDVIQPFSLEAGLQQGDGMCKGTLTFNYKLKFRKANKGIEVRAFAGSFLFTNEFNNRGPYRFRTSGQTGSQDYLYDHTYLGRSELPGTTLGNQFTETDGGFKFLSYVGQTANWITALNIKSSLGNVPLPLKVYADIGTTASDGFPKKPSLLYDAGVCISTPKNVIEVFFPLFICKEFQDYKDLYHVPYTETIRFTLNLNVIDPFSLIRNFKL
jgi:hypothetical protein